jgi:putative transposase
MTYHPQIHHRRSIRLKGYDYSSAGYYFVTICTNGRLEFFGEIVEGKTKLSNGGEMVERLWLDLPDRFEGVILDQFVIMPNHFHAIIILSKNLSQTLGQILGTFKSLTTLEYTKLVKEKQASPFDKKLWQLNFYERIIRNDNELLETQNYIINNPSQWELDKLNPKNDNP